MAGNFNCSSCSHAASFFCFCVPEKVYLCEVCIGHHCQKGGAHAIAPISAQEAVFKPQDIEDYNRKRQVVQELTALLDDMSERLSTEKDQLSTNLNQIYSDQVNLLYSAYVKAEVELTAWYQGISDALQRVKQDIKKCEHEHSSSLTEDTLRFVQIAAHIRESAGSYINLTEELNNRISLTFPETEPTTSSEFGRVLDSWGLQPCQCHKCLIYQQTLVTQVVVKPKQSSDIPSSALIGCPHFPKNKRLTEYPCCGKLYPCYMCHDEDQTHKHKSPTTSICKLCGLNQSVNNVSCKQCKANFRDNK